MEIYTLFSLVVILVLFYAGAWISSAETALFSLSSHKVKTYENDSDPVRRLIAHLLSHPRDLLVTVFMINTCVNILLQNVFSNMFGPEAGLMLKVGVPLVLTLVFGEIIPKYIGLQNNVAIAHQVSPTLDRLNNALKWVRKVIIAITNPISRIMFFFLKPEEGISKEELEHVIHTSTEQGVLEHGEAELLEGFLNLLNRPIKELMWPKEDIVFYDIADPLTELIHLFKDEEYTRIPICNGSLEHVLGIMTAMDYFKHQDKIETPKDILKYLQKPFYVPVTSSARSLLKRMDEASHILALIVDEYGSIMGLISRENLIELVVGHIEDEKNQSLFIAAEKNEVIASGKWELSELDEYFEANLKSQNHVTIGGWLTEKLGDIPKTGTKIEFEGFYFHVLAASPTRITRLFIRKLTKGKP